MFKLNFSAEVEQFLNVAMAPASPAFDHDYTVNQQRQEHDDIDVPQQDNIDVPEQNDIADVHHGDAPNATDPQQKVGQCGEQVIRDLGEYLAILHHI